MAKKEELLAIAIEEKDTANRNYDKAIRKFEWAEDLIKRHKENVILGNQQLDVELQNEENKKLLEARGLHDETELRFFSWRDGMGRAVKDLELYRKASVKTHSVEEKLKIAEALKTHYYDIYKWRHSKYEAGNAKK